MQVEIVHSNILVAVVSVVADVLWSEVESGIITTAATTVGGICNRLCGFILIYKSLYSVRRTDKNITEVVNYYRLFGSAAP